MPRIIPIRDLRDTTKIADMCRESEDPIFVTKNGYGEMVIMSMLAYEEKMARIEMHDAIIEGEKQAEEGKLVDGETFFAALGEKYGLL